jgi:hypothetical protein
MYKIIKSIPTILFTIILLSACGNISFEKQSNLTEKAVKNTFNSKTVNKPNYHSGKFSFYLPFGYEVKNKYPNNIIIKNGSKTYILFINPKEKSSSDVVYKATAAKYKKPEMNKTFKSNNKFGYLLIHQLPNDKNELTIGVGGSKMTTQTLTGSLEEESKMMMKIVKSVKVKK